MFTALLPVYAQDTYKNLSTYFGTMTAHIGSSPLYNTTRGAEFGTDLQNRVAKIVVKGSVQYLSTGSRIYYDEDYNLNSTHVNINWGPYNSSYTGTKLAFYGTHEIIQGGSDVIYTYYGD